MAKKGKPASAQKSKKKDLKQVQEHYVDYPYPYRDPEDEKKRTLRIFGDFLIEMNHWLYKGKETFKDNFRVLVAGGGTGDSIIFLADQLKDTNAEIVYLDFSKASMEIAQKRAEYRGLKNIKWINDSILNIPQLKLGKFDFINCVGVLHHLASPDEGLKILQESLTEKGGMSLMVYAQYGRTGVYHIQELMRMVNKNVTTRAVEVKNGWSIINSLPASNWYVRAKELISDLQTMGDIGMYDLFLHKQDRAYTIPQLYNFVHGAGLNFVTFTMNEDRVLLKLDNYIKDQDLLAELKKRDIIEQQAMCEIICGKIIKHSFYVSNQKDSKASFDDLDNVPYFRTKKGQAKEFYDHLEDNPQLVGSLINFTWKSDVGSDLNVNIPISSFTKYLFKYMIDETRSFKEIFDATIAETGEKVAYSDLLQATKNTLTVMEEIGAVVLRHKSVDPLPSLWSEAV